jgi:hypothetical protein
MATELGGSVFEITRGLIGDLFRAKKRGRYTLPQVVKSHCWHGHVSSDFMTQHCFNMYYHEQDKSHNNLVKSTSSRA